MSTVFQPNKPSGNQYPNVVALERIRPALLVQFHNWIWKQDGQMFERPPTSTTTSTPSLTEPTVTETSDSTGTDHGADTLASQVASSRLPFEFEGLLHSLTCEKEAALNDAIMGRLDTDGAYIASDDVLLSFMPEVGPSDEHVSVEGPVC